MFLRTDPTLPESVYGRRATNGVIARDLAPADTPALTDLYGDYEWWADHDLEGVRRALEGTEVAVDIEAEGELVAAARVLTDGVYYANVFDVIVAANHRGEGCGQEFLEAVIDHSDLQEVAGLSLLCRRGLVPYYESVGFEFFDPEMEVPEGGAEELARMTYRQEKRAAEVETTDQGISCSPSSS